MLKYSDAVKTLLRASGMTDADITTSEFCAEQNLRRFIAAIRRPSVSAEKQRRFARTHDRFSRTEHGSAPGS
jgi:hypothetical protein